jgi:DNA replication factor Dna2
MSQCAVVYVENVGESSTQCTRLHFCHNTSIYMNSALSNPYHPKKTKNGVGDDKYHATTPAARAAGGPPALTGATDDASPASWTEDSPGSNLGGPDLLLMAFTQDCIEWDESSNVDLRQLVHDTARTVATTRAHVSPARPHHAEEEIDGIFRSLAPTTAREAIANDDEHHVSTARKSNQRPPRLEASELLAPGVSRKRRRHQEQNAKENANQLLPTILKDQAATTRTPPPLATHAFGGTSTDFRDLLEELSTPKEKDTVAMLAPQPVAEHLQTPMATLVPDAMLDEKLAALPAMDAAPKSSTVPPHPALKTTFPGLDDDDDLEFSMEDLEAMDALVLQATSQSQSTQDAVLTAHPIPSVPPMLLPPQPPMPLPVVPHRPTSDMVVPPLILPADEYDDDFANVDFDELDKLVAAKTSQLNATATREPPPPGVVRNLRTNPSPGLQYLGFSRYLVLNVHDDTNTYTKSLRVAAWQHDMLREVRPQPLSRHERSHWSTTTDWPVAGMVHLRGEWYHTRVEPQHVIHVCSLQGRFHTHAAALPLVLHTCPPAGSDMDDDLVLIVHPDVLLTPTGISDTISCTRRAVLKQRVGSPGFGIAGTFHRKPARLRLHILLTHIFFASRQGPAAGVHAS